LEQQMLGERFGNFKAVAKLGRGAMGEVFLAHHQRIDRRAAIKVLMPEGTQDAELVRRFFIEARATSLIRHPGIVQVYDCDVHRNGRAYIVMEYLEGETLANRLERFGVLPWSSACRITRLVADAIGAAHEKKIIHRDLKPGNVFLLCDTDWPEPAEVKVLDFGVAKLLEGDGAGGPGTTAGRLLGTPEYMSPEHCSGASRVDHRGDVYSLGCMLFEMIVGAPPFTSSHVREVLASHKFRKPPSLAALTVETPTWLDGLVTRMLSKEPDQRPQTMAEVAGALAIAEGARADHR
jgi:eukaryotic-like serine/threonine-protein kinase